MQTLWLTVLPIASLGCAALAVGLLIVHWVSSRAQLAQRVAELSAIEQIGRAIAQTQPDVDRLCRLLYEQVSAVADTTIFSLGLFEGDNYTFKLWMQEGKPEPLRAFHLTPGVGLVSWMRESHRPLLIRDFEREMESLPARPAYVSDRPPRSAIFVPLMAGDAVIGTMSAQSYRRNAYALSDLRLLSAMANQAATAIQKARLYEAEQQQAWLSTALLQVADALSHLSDMDEVLTTITRLTPMLAGVDRCGALLWDDDNETFVPTRSYGLTPAQRGRFESMTIREGAWPALDVRRYDPSPLLVPLHDANGSLPPDITAAFGAADFLAVLPLLAQGEFLGVLLVGYGRQAGPSNERILPVLLGIANQAAMVIQGARLLQAQREEAYISMALLQVAEATSHSGGLSESLAAIVRITPLLVGVDACAIFLWDSAAAAFSPYQQHGLPKEAQSAFWGLRLSLDNPAVSQLRAGRAYLTVEDMPELADIASVLSRGSLLILPVAVKGELVALMSVDRSVPFQRFTQRRLSILTGIANQVAAAIDNDRLVREAAERQKMQQELEVARRIQASFLPNCCPTVPGWELAAIWRSAGQVAGDFYDFVPLHGNRGEEGENQDRLGIVIADVADKGVPAALFMALSRTLMRTVATSCHSPAATVAQANNLIVADAGSEMFVTLFYAILSPNLGWISYTNAGHLPPLLARANGKRVEQLRTGGIAMGVLAGFEYEEHSHHLDPGDTLVLYTDGIVEAVNSEGQMFGRERLRDTIQANLALPAADLAQVLVEAVNAFAGDARQSDDLTLVVARRLSSATKGP